jgi:hypothetical protein
MIFGLDADTGSRVVGWLVPDNPSMTPTLDVLVAGQSRCSVTASIVRDDIKASGLHETGICGFVIDAQACPGFAPGVDLEVFDARTNLLVYRRCRQEPLPLRLFHLETQTAPIYPLAWELTLLLQMIYGSAEFIGQDTLAGIFNLGFTESVFVSGALSYPRYHPHLRARAFRRSVLLGDPNRELAARLLQLQALGRAGGGDGGWRSLGQPDLAAALSDADLRDPDVLEARLRTIPEETLIRLDNPTTRQFIARAPDVPIAEDVVAIALGALAEFDVVGFTDDLDAFVWDIEALLGRRGLSRAEAEGPPDLDAVTYAVSAGNTAQALVRLDIMLLDLARQAVAGAE